MFNKVSPFTLPQLISHPSSAVIAEQALPFLVSKVHSYMPTEFMSDFLEKPIENSIREKLLASLQPTHLQVLNESYMHAVSKGSETHFKVVVVSNSFDGVKLIERHRKINDILSEELAGGVHALSIHAKTPKQWQDSDEKFPKSPPCRGGMGL